MRVAPRLRSALGSALLVAGPVLAAPPSRPPAPAQGECGSCHPVPPQVGAHAKHSRERVACADCHGEGYLGGRTDPGLHENGKNDVAEAAGWDQARRTCANRCHGKETWPSSSKGGERDERDREHGQHHDDRDHDDDREHHRDHDDDREHHRDHDRDHD